MTTPAQSPADREIVITRVLAAPRELVWEAWTKPEHLTRWWGPKGFTNPVCDWDVRPGGKIHGVMRAPGGEEYPMGGEIREIIAPEKLVFTSGALDGQGNLMFEFLHVLELAEQGRRTSLTLRSRLLGSSAGSERYTNGFKAGMTQSWERLAELVEVTAPREIIISRIVSAPRELVWQAWTDPQHVVQWWGPRGFTTTITRMEFRVGGVWEHVMRGPDGANYPNKSLFKEIVPLERIVYAHGGGRADGPDASFVATWTFAPVASNKTRVTARMVFPTAEARDFVAREFGAIEGGRQTLERLGEHLAEAQVRPFVISREFAAPRELVWQVWTQVEHLKEWFGPRGVTSVSAKLDFRPGGMFHYGMQTPDGTRMWGRFVYREIVAPERIVWVNSFSDEAGGLGRHPFSPTWPQQMLTVVTFAEQAGRTTVTVKWTPLDATSEEQQTFDAGRSSMTQGWGGTFDRLAVHLTDTPKHNPGGRAEPAQDS